MEKTGHPYCCTSYETINADGSHRNYVHVDSKITYNSFLKKPPTCSHTIMFDTEVVSKSDLVMPALRRGQDAATWLHVIKKYGPLYGMKDVLACNRKTPGSLSSSKSAAIKRTWFLYTKVEKLRRPYALYCLLWQMYHAAVKRVGKLK